MNIGKVVFWLFLLRNMVGVYICVCIFRVVVSVIVGNVIFWVLSLYLFVVVE